MNPDPEIRRLLDVMPASGRMIAKISSNPKQATVIQCQRPFLRLQECPITINFGLWSQLTQPQRDLLIIRTVTWIRASHWFKPDLYQGAVGAGVVATLVEFVQGDVIGLVAAASLSAIAATQIWRASRGARVDLDADNAALTVAQRRRYSEADAAHHLLTAIQAVAHLEGRASLDFNDLIRCQNLRAISELTTLNGPERFQ